MKNNIPLTIIYHKVNKIIEKIAFTNNIWILMNLEFDFFFYYLSIPP